MPLLSIVIRLVASLQIWLRVQQFSVAVIINWVEPLHMMNAVSVVEIT